MIPNFIQHEDDMEHDQAVMEKAVSSEEQFCFHCETDAKAQCDDCQCCHVCCRCGAGEG